MLKNTFREIKNSKARFISIMAIIALGVGFFAGIKATVPSMYHLAETYYDEQSLMDYRLVSTVGFDEEDIAAISSTDGVTGVVPSYFCDVQTASKNNGEVVRVIALPTTYKDNSLLNKLVVKEGRLPKKSDEIVADAGSFTKGGYKIGEKIIVNKMTGETDTTTQLKCLEYTVVGLVQSPVYISYQRGATTVGNGKIADFMYVMPEDFAFERYTEIYVKTDASDRFTAFSDEYNAQIEQDTAAFENVADERCKDFDVNVIKKAKDDLQEAKDKYNDEKQNAETKLKDALTQIDDAKEEYDTQISDAQKKLDDAKSQLDSAKAKLKESKAEYYAGIESAENLIIEKEAELESGRKKYNSSKEEYDIKIADAQQKLDDGWSEYNSAYNDFKENKEPLILFGISQAQNAVDNLKLAISVESDPAVLAVLNTQLKQAQSVLDGLNAQYQSALEQLEGSKALLDENQRTFDAQKQEGQNQLDSALAQLNDGENKLAMAKTELETKRAEGLAALNSAQQQIDFAQIEYDNGIAEFTRQKADGKQKLDDAKTEYNEKKSEADEKFAEAEDKIEDAQSKIDELSSPEWYVFTRDDNPGFATFSQNAERLNAVASVFPMFFLLVAVLVCVTTMTRLIEEKRTEIGTFKALGYSNSSIIMKFVIYSLFAALIGGTIGVFLGIFTIPFIIYNAYKIMYYIGDITLVPDFVSIALGMAAAVVCTSAVSVIVCMRSLHHKPAAIMRPKAPKAGKRIILERIKPLWSHLSFNSKLTARNLLRYKSRLCMTVIGVAGCTALIVAAFGLLNSFDPLTKDQFETIYKYDAVAVPKKAGTAQQLEYLVSKVDNNKNVLNAMLCMQEECTVEYGQNIKDSDTYLAVMQYPENLDSIISLHTRQDKKALPLTDEGVLINEKLADEFNIKVGKTIKLSSDSGSAEVKVCGIFEQYLNNYIYMTPSLYKSLYDCDVEYNMLDVNLDDTSKSTEDSFGLSLLSDDRIVAVNFIASSIKDFENMLDSLNMVVMVMIICAAALAFVVLYNLTNINIAERVREIATFKVLGFYNKETSAFIYKENIILTILGIAAGLFLGVFLTGFIVQTVEVDNVMFGREIYFSSFVLAAGLTMLFSLLVNAVMSFKIRAVNMVESLKSVE